MKVRKNCVSVASSTETDIMMDVVTAEKVQMTKNNNYLLIPRRSHHSSQLESDQKFLLCRTQALE